MTIAEQIIEDVERLKKSGATQEEIRVFVDSALRVGTAVMLAII